MGWFVRYIDDELKHEMLSRELASEEEALEEAWQLAQGENEIIGIDGPDEQTVPLEEIQEWFESRSAMGETGTPS
jgi:cobalamin biosynthesis Mg chelatase CobN